MWSNSTSLTKVPPPIRPVQIAPRWAPTSADSRHHERLFLSGNFAIRLAGIEAYSVSPQLLRGVASALMISASSSPRSSNSITASRFHTREGKEACGPSPAACVHSKRTGRVETPHPSSYHPSQDLANPSLRKTDTISINMKHGSTMCAMSSRPGSSGAWTSQTHAVPAPPAGVTGLRNRGFAPCSHVGKAVIGLHGPTRTARTRTGREASAMVASIGVIASASQGVSYFERDGYYTKDDPAHKEASAWVGRGAEDLGLSGSGCPGPVAAAATGGRARRRAPRPHR